MFLDIKALKSLDQAIKTTTDRKESQNLQVKRSNKKI